MHMTLVYLTCYHTHLQNYLLGSTLMITVYCLTWKSCTPHDKYRMSSIARDVQQVANQRGHQLSYSLSKSEDKCNSIFFHGQVEFNTQANANITHCLYSVTAWHA